MYRRFNEANIISQKIANTSVMTIITCMKMLNTLI